MAITDWVKTVDIRVTGRLFFLYSSLRDDLAPGEKCGLGLVQTYLSPGLKT